MLRIIIISILMVNAIFWGIYPPSKNSPHNQVLHFFNIKRDVGLLSHLMVGLFFYITAFYISHINLIF
tara:strand:+ start:212 stop:415 length:204 start_codon:yes stop_codon:yes gene_type:complete